MPGKVIKIAVNEGDAVSKGDILLVVEAMKMENNILSPADAVVDRINVVAGNLVDSNTTLVLGTSKVKSIRELMVLQFVL